MFHHENTIFELRTVKNRNANKLISCSYDNKIVTGSYELPFDSDSDQTKKEIVTLSVGNTLTAGIDSSGEMHIWGKIKHTSIPKD